MTPLKLIVALSAFSAASHALAWDYVLLDTDKAAQELAGHQPAARHPNRQTLQRHFAHFARWPTGGREHRGYR